MAVALVASPTVAAAGLPGAPSGGAAPDRKDPQFEAVVPEPELVPGIQQQLTVQLLNDAEDPANVVETARDVRVTVDGEGTPVEVVSGERLVGPVQDGRPAPVTVRVSVPADAAPGSYDVSLRVTYEHRNEDGELISNSTTVEATVRIDERPRFRVVASNTSAPIGDTGTLNVTVENVGSAAARDATLTLQSTSASVAFGESASASQFVGRWEPGERRTLQFDVSVAPSAEQRTYSMQATVAYDDPDGKPSQSRPLRLGIRPLPEQTFALRNVESRLHVGEEGEVVMEVVNTGERQVDSVVVLFTGASPTVTPVETQFALGSLAPGESKTVRFDAEVSDTAESGPRQFTFRVEYRNAEDQKRASDPLDARVTVGERRPTFQVEGVAATVTAGSSGRLELTVTNNRDQPLRDVSAKLFADSPLSAADDEAFVEKLGPGESATLAFEVGAAGGALEKTYPVEVDFRYDDADGDSRISDTYQVPVQVTQPEDSGGPLDGILPFAVGGALVVLLVLAGGYVYVRRE